MSYEWKNKQTDDAINAFFKQFGNLDYYSNIVLEVIFEELYGKNSLSLPSQKRQIGDKDDVPISNGKGD
jgi:hypothetical protein